ncbi:hypothetical protein SRABI128_04799 [Microbacterium sp. Bi128]|nr:hypothetical protein SRABI128_04799 [Microbacterium sp. Bi128]
MGSITVSPAITRSGGPTEYAVCTKYAPTPTAARSATRHSSVSQSKLPAWARLMTTLARVATKP